VIEQPLAEFLAARRMAGVILLRPVEPQRARRRRAGPAKAIA
jgi:hypothetical protein